MEIMKNENITVREPVSDYVGEDGLLRCGLCHEPKEARFPEGTVFPEGIDKYPRSCACERARRKKEARENEARRHSWAVYVLRRNCFNDHSLSGMTFAASAISTEQVEACRRYADLWETARENNFGLLLWGDVGTGKSYLAACIANALIEKEVSVRMLNFGQILNTGFDEKARILGVLSKYDLLILDDFGMERRTEYAQEIVFQVIDTRYQSRKPMIVTTNLSLQTLKSPADLEEERIYSRILEACIPVHFDGENLREKICLKKTQEFRAMISDIDTGDTGGEYRK